jgi:hypothetical protein
MTKENWLFTAVSEKKTTFLVFLTLDSPAIVQGYQQFPAFLLEREKSHLRSFVIFVVTHTYNSIIREQRWGKNMKTIILTPCMYFTFLYFLDGSLKGLCHEVNILFQISAFFSWRKQKNKFSFLLQL